MTSELLIDLAWKGTALALVALAAGWCCRRASATVRSYVYLLAFAGLMLLPLSAFLPQWSPLPPTSAPIEVPVIGAAIESVTPTTGTLSLPEIEWMAVAGWIWLGGTLSALLALGVGLLRTRKLVRSCSPLRIESKAPVLIAPTEGSAFTVGLRRPVIVLPANANQWSEERVRAVIRHEQAHIDRKDWARLILMRLVRAMYWPNPLVWVLEGQAVLAGEQACDDQVLLEGTNPAGYAMHLLEIARTASNGYNPVAQAATGSWLESRLRAILNDSGQRGGLPMRWKVLCLLLAMATVGVVAPVTASQDAPTPAVAALAPVPAQTMISAPAGVSRASAATPVQARASVATVKQTRPVKTRKQSTKSRATAMVSQTPLAITQPSKATGRSTPVAIATPRPRRSVPLTVSAARTADVAPLSTPAPMETFETPATVIEAPAQTRGGSGGNAPVAQTQVAPARAGSGSGQNAVVAQTRSVPARASGGSGGTAQVAQSFARPARAVGGSGSNVAPVTTVVDSAGVVTTVTSGSGASGVVDAPMQVTSPRGVGGSGSNAVLVPAQSLGGSGKGKTPPAKKPLKTTGSASSGGGSGRGGN